MTISYLVEDFLKWKKTHMRHPEAYRTALRPLVERYGGQETSSVSIGDITNLIASIQGETHYFLSVLKVLARFAHYSNIPFVNPMLIRVKRKYDSPPSFLTQEEVEALCGGCEMDTFIGVRNRCVIEMLYQSGARLNELLALTLKSLEDGQRPYARITTEKSGEFGFLMWSEETHRLLQTYLGMRISRDWKTDRLFINKNGAALTDRGVEHMMAKISEETLGKRAHPHQLRHSRARRVLELGGGLVEVQKKLRHKNIQSSLKYLRFFSQEMVKMLAKYSQ
jgi:site-specific recombinase XerD